MWGRKQSTPILLCPREIFQVKIFAPGDGAISEGEFLKGCLEDADLVRCCWLILISFCWFAGSGFCGLVLEFDNTQIITLFYYLRWETSRTNKKQEMFDQNLVSLFCPKKIHIRTFVSFMSRKLGNISVCMNPVGRNWKFEIEWNSRYLEWALPEHPTIAENSWRSGTYITRPNGLDRSASWYLIPIQRS